MVDAQLQEVVAEAGPGCTVLAIPLDVTKTDSIRNFVQVQQTTQRADCVHVLPTACTCCMHVLPAVYMLPTACMWCCLLQHIQTACTCCCIPSEALLICFRQQFQSMAVSTF